MAERREKPTVVKVIHLGNAVTWLRNEILRAEGLTASQGEAIRFILRRYGNGQSNITASDLMEHLALSQSTVAGILKRLEAKGFITRSVDRMDARRSFIVPTEKGMELRKAIRERMDESEAIMLAGLSGEERREFDRLLQKGLDNINAWGREKEGEKRK